jgi:predicted Rossmann-fold nucleotide-binding protein
MMEAASKATMELGGRVGGIRIGKEAGTRVLQVRSLLMS